MRLRIIAEIKCRNTESTKYLVIFERDLYIEFSRGTNTEVNLTKWRDAIFSELLTQFNHRLLI